MIIYKITHIPSQRFYIGRTIQKLEKRVKQHKQNIKTKSIISCLLKKYPLVEFHWEIIDGIVGEKTDDNFNHLIELEQKYIDRYIKTNLCVNLSNSAKGPGFNVCRNKKKVTNSKEHIKKFRDNYLNWWINKTPEEDLIRSNNLREAHEARLIPINMYSIKNEYINTFKSIRAIVRKYPNLRRECISRVLHGKYKQHQGFMFVYNNKNNDRPFIK